MSAVAGENLIPGLRGGGWRTWSPRAALTPVFSTDEAEGHSMVKIESGGGFHRYGAWRCDVRGIRGGQTYSFDVEYLPQDVDDEAVSIYALLSWAAQDGRMLTREYADGLLRLGDGWRRACLTTEAPKDACSLVVDLALRWTDRGEVTWRRPWLSAAEPAPRRSIRVATTYLRQRHDKKRNLQAVLSILDRAGERRSDIVVISETFVDRGDCSPQSIPGELTRAVAAKAAEHRCHVVFSLNEVEGKRYYNTAVLFDRKGAIAGRYRKTHLPLAEAELGITPGSDYPVFETDFGTVSMLICWDHWFPETSRILRARGAEIILISTIGDAPLQSVARAVDNAIPVVVAGADGRVPSRIIDADGSIIGEIANDGDDVCVREIDLDRRSLHHWLSVGDADGDPHNLLLKERRTDTYAIPPAADRQNRRRS